MGPGADPGRCSRGPVAPALRGFGALRGLPPAFAPGDARYGQSAGSAGSGACGRSGVRGALPRPRRPSLRLCVPAPGGLAPRPVLPAVAGWSWCPVADGTRWCGGAAVRWVFGPVAARDPHRESCARVGRNRHRG
ncbi:hypothetical protein SCWH03_43840 [Streptomyces pacificus]|uniref:Uncharacterized protein n=1 Tax=Streptomyces pacificus TaxID=2705029 RepID=A0A6A0B1J9_9ACTN|nr:hypothetical protein SCWH03_43840 [Streptomyces pacificus]